MIKTTRQNWKKGEVVNVGFLRLRVKTVRAEYDSLPDIYELESLDGLKQYEFIPHNGLHLVAKLSVPQIEQSIEMLLV